MNRWLAGASGRGFARASRRRQHGEHHQPWCDKRGGAYATACRWARLVGLRTVVGRRAVVPVVAGWPGRHARVVAGVVGEPTDQSIERLYAVIRHTGNI